MNTPFGNMITTAEHAIAMMFTVARQIPEANASTQSGKAGKIPIYGGGANGQNTRAYAGTLAALSVNAAKG